MVQEFHVVRCSVCLTFQVHQVKKVSKWICKLCGQKQSLLKEFGRGSGADCRRHVQKLNAMRGTMIEEKQHNTMLLCEQEEVDEDLEQPEETQVENTEGSRWSKYLNPAGEAEPEEENEENLVMDRNLHGDRFRFSRKRQKPEPDELEDACSPAQPKLRLPARPCNPSTKTTCTKLNIQEDASKSGRSQPRTAVCTPRLPFSSMFESGEDFNWDEDF